ncbi:MAG: amidohydrolase [Gammaproteobacteria bacterium]|nr:amidohydrolase [Gammaproteobacteria bacterium]NNJ50359.1 amidohydrolase family protein [Gammaproteobacteria bacterium]
MMTRHKLYQFLLLALSLLPLGLVAGPIFDAHLHYDAADARVLDARAVIEIFDRNDIRYAVVTGAPSSHARQLYGYAPERIVPLLGVYRDHADKADWHDDASLPSYVETELEQGVWQGVGELHLFAKDRHSPVFRRIVEIVSSRQLPMLVHGDPAVIDTVFDIAPKMKLIWAHAGTFPYPDLIADYLQRYPAMIIDLSMREERIAPQGRLDDAWYELFVTHPDRFMVGVDTYSLSRWQQFDAASERIRDWLSQLPDDVARRLAYENAARFFNKSE